MRTALVLLLSLASISCAQEKDKKSTNAPEKKRLESVTWDLKSHKLVWMVQRGSELNGEFVPISTLKYEISPDEAVMAVAQEKRGFTEEEAASLHRLLDTLSLYCAESVVWWDQGQGVKLGPDGKPSEKSKPDLNKGQRVDEHPAPKPPAVRKGDSVALLHVAEYQ